MGGSAPSFHLGYNPILGGIKNNCPTNWGQLVQLIFDKCSLYKKRKSPPILFTHPQTNSVLLRRLVGILKIIALGNKITFWRNVHSFAVPLRCKCSSWCLGRNPDRSYQKKKKKGKTIWKLGEWKKFVVFTNISKKFKPSEQFNLNLFHLPGKQLGPNFYN